MDKVDQFYVNLDVTDCKRLYDYAACEWIDQPASGIWDPSAWRGRGKIDYIHKEDENLMLQVSLMDRGINDVGWFEKDADKGHLEQDKQEEVYADPFDVKIGVDSLPFRVLPEYKPGDVVSGTVVMMLRENIEADDLEIEFFGRAMTQIRVYHRYGYHDTRGFEIYTKERQCLWKSTNQSDSKDVSDEFALLDPSESTVRSKDLSAGYHKYPFTFRIPSNAIQSVPTIIPSPVNYSNIVWRLKATVNRGKLFGRGDMVAHHGIWVDTLINIAGIPENFEPQVVVESLDTTQLAFWKSGKITVTATLPQKAFLHGQDIPIRVEIDNQSSGEIKDIKARIEIHGRAKESTGTFSKIMSMSINVKGTKIKSGPIGAGMNPVFDWVLPWDFSESSVDSNLVPVGNLTESAIVDVRYDVMVYVKRKSPHRDMKLQVPIIIGNLNDETIPPTKLDEIKPDVSFVYKTK